MRYGTYSKKISCTVGDDTIHLLLRKFALINQSRGINLKKTIRNKLELTSIMNRRIKNYDPAH